MTVRLPISLALCGLDAAAIGIAAAGGGSPVDRGPEVRAMIEWAGGFGAGLRAIQLNAATPGVRPRDLDRSARRDLAATMRRLDLVCSGLDLWVPTEHFVEPGHVDRAVESVLSAIDMARDLASLASGSVVSTSPSVTARSIAVSVVLPEKIAPNVLAAMAERARARGIHVADHAWPARVAEATPPGVGVGLDPAALLVRGEDPAAIASRLGSRVASARLTDVAGPSGGAGVRVAPGSRTGRLDLLAYTVALVTSGYRGHLVLDVRGLADPAMAVREAVAAVAGDG